MSGRGKLVRRAGAIYRLLVRMEDLFLMTCLSVIAIALLLQVVFRYLLNSPLSWSEELSRYLLVWITFFGIHYGLRRKKHIEMGYFYNKFPERLQIVVTLLTQTIILVFVWYLIASSFRFVRAQVPIGSSAMQISMGIVYIAIPIGISTSSMSMLIDVFRLIGKLLIHQK